MEKAKMGVVYKRCDEVLGIRYWRVDYINSGRSEVFRVVAHNPDSGMFMFKSVLNPNTTITRSYYQLDTNGFHPFCIPGGKKGE